MHNALRYCHIPSAAKLVVGQAPDLWAHDVAIVGLLAESQQPFNAETKRLRQECNDNIAFANGEVPAAFTRLDSTSSIIPKHLHTKIAFLANAQDRGTAQVKTYTSKQQRRLHKIIEDAQEWGNARHDHEMDKLSGWERLCKTNGRGCCHPNGACSYAPAAEQICARNAASLSPPKMASHLREILVPGPKKICRTQMLANPSNTGGSTLLHPFDDSLAPKHVLHKPVVGYPFCLRNINKKKFIFWDDYPPIGYAHERTTPVATSLSLVIGKNTEVQTSQSFNDVNLDVQWSQGAAFIAKDARLMGHHRPRVSRRCAPHAGPQ